MSVLSLIDRGRQLTFFQLFTVYVRYLIGGAFVIAAIGMKKLSGSSPDIAEVDVPRSGVPLLFYTLGSARLYWQFIGYSQLVSGFLLMTQRFARLGVLIFFPLILNIFFITVAYKFKGTPLVTGLMLLATIYLLIWDFRIFQYIVIAPPNNKPIPNVHDKTQQPYWVIVGLLLFSTIPILFTIGLKDYLWIIIVGILEGAIALLIFLFMNYRKHHAF